MKKIDFTKPYIDDDIIESVVDTLKSGWITTGPKVQQLEKIICDKFNINNCLCLNSWTNAAESILRWYGIQENDEVIVPVMTYCATANIILHCKAKPIFVDICDNMNINIEKINSQINKNTKAIIAVDIGGNSCEYDKIIDIINENKNKFISNNENQNKLGRILLISDAAHSIGTKYKNKYSCNYADFTVFSFHAVKNITTAEGGAICFNLPKPYNNDCEYKYFKMFTLHGQNKTALDKYKSDKINNNYWDYDILLHGYKFNMPDILACIALEQLKKFDYLMDIRKNIIKKYYNLLSKNNNIIFITNINEINNSSWHLLCIRIKNFNNLMRDKLLNEMHLLYGISMNVHFKPLPLLTAFNDYNINNYPIANEIYSNILSLPLHYYLSDDDINYICNNLLNTIDKIFLNI